MTEPIRRQVIPGGSFEDPIAHLFPIAQLHIDRGHQPLWEMYNETFGFRERPDGWVCELRGNLTPADRDAVNATFELPENITWLGVILRDSANWTDMYGLTVPADF